MSKSEAKKRRGIDESKIDWDAVRQNVWDRLAEKHDGWVDLYMKWLRREPMTKSEFNRIAYLRKRMLDNGEVPPISRNQLWFPPESKAERYYQAMLDSRARKKSKLTTQVETQ